MNQVNLRKTTFQKLSDTVCLGGPYHSLKIFKGCLPQILLGPFLSTLIQVYVALSVTNTESFLNWGYVAYVFKVNENPILKYKRLKKIDVVQFIQILLIATVLQYYF